MLPYVNHGPRWYHSHPVLPARRNAWEFQAVLNGSISLLQKSGPDFLYRRTLWLFPPRHLHGWTGEKNKKAEIAVFHFRSVPEPLARLVGEKFLRISFTEKECHRLRELAQRLIAYSGHPAPGMIMASEHALLELSLMIYERCASGDAKLNEDRARQHVDAALHWFEDHLEENPGLDEIARATATSPSHLRRLFHEILQASPKQIFDQIRFHRATLLMSDPEVKLSNVSEVCGFGSPSAFSRAFKNKFGCSPDSWRG